LFSDFGFRVSDLFPLHLLALPALGQGSLSRWPRPPTQISADSTSVRPQLPSQRVRQARGRFFDDEGVRGGRARSRR